MRKSDLEIPADLQRLCRRLDKHRNSKGKGRRLPDGIWRSAAEVARNHGVSLVARILSLDYYKLKEQSGVPASNSPASPAFVELMPSPEYRDDSCVTIDIHSESGDRMTMRLPTLDGRVAVELVQAFRRSS